MQLQIGGSTHWKETKPFFFQDSPDPTVFPCPSSTCSLPFLSSPLSDMLVHPSPPPPFSISGWYVHRTKSTDGESNEERAAFSVLPSSSRTMFFKVPSWGQALFLNYFTKRQPTYGDNRHQTSVTRKPGQHCISTKRMGRNMNRKELYNLSC